METENASESLNPLELTSVMINPSEFIIPEKITLDPVSEESSMEISITQQIESQQITEDIKSRFNYNARKLPENFSFGRRRGSKP